MAQLMQQPRTWRPLLKNVGTDIIQVKPVASSTPKWNLPPADWQTAPGTVSDDQTMYDQWARLVRWNETSNTPAVAGPSRPSQRQKSNSSLKRKQRSRQVSPRMENASLEPTGHGPHLGQSAYTMDAAGSYRTQPISHSADLLVPHESSRQASTGIKGLLSSASLMFKGGSQQGNSKSSIVRRATSFLRGNREREARDDAETSMYRPSSRSSLQVPYNRGVNRSAVSVASSVASYGAVIPTKLGSSGFNQDPRFASTDTLARAGLQNPAFEQGMDPRRIKRSHSTARGPGHHDSQMVMAPPSGYSHSTNQYLAPPSGFSPSGSTATSYHTQMAVEDLAAGMAAMTPPSGFSHSTNQYLAPPSGYPPSGLNANPSQHYTPSAAYSPFLGGPNHQLPRPSGYSPSARHSHQELSSSRHSPSVGPPYSHLPTAHGPLHDSRTRYDMNPGPSQLDRRPSTTSRSTRAPNPIPISAGRSAPPQLSWHPPAVQGMQIFGQPAVQPEPQALPAGALQAGGTWLSHSSSSSKTSHRKHEKDRHDKHSHGHGRRSESRSGTWDGPTQHASSSSRTHQPSSSRRGDREDERDGQ